MPPLLTATSSILFAMLRLAGHILKKKTSPNMLASFSACYPKLLATLQRGISVLAHGLWIVVAMESQELGK